MNLSQYVTIFGKYGHVNPCIFREIVGSCIAWRNQVLVHSQPRTVCSARCFASNTNPPRAPGQTKKIDLSKFPLERIRNFSIIAHVDHGKSTLADRLLEITGAIDPDNKNEQVLDKLQVERERGITVKAQTASLFYEYNGETYLLNLIDTPGHVDFNYEVARSLAACQGVILLVDANQGVQAQTVANFYLAFEADLAIVTVMNKIDLKVAKPEEVATQIHNVFDVPPDEVIKISAKLGTGVDKVLRSIVENIPSPQGDPNKPLKALLFDSWFDKYRGVVSNIAVTDGVIRKGERIMTFNSGKTYEVLELGILHPGEEPTDVLYPGQVGYMYSQMKSPAEAQLGDTICHPSNKVEPFPGFREARPMVFAGVFPMELNEYSALKTAISKLTLNDPSVQLNPDSSAALGQGWRLGFLGLLHMDVFSQRLEQEFDANVIVTAPNVPYKAHIYGSRNIKFYGTDVITVLNPSLMPPRDITAKYEEPMVVGTIISPDTYIGEIMSLVMDRRGQFQEQTYIDDKRLIFKAILPLNEIVVDFFDVLKSVTSGYASFDYEDNGYQDSDLVKIDFLLNGLVVEELTQIAHISKARTMAKYIVGRLLETLPAQLFEIAIQGKVGAKVLARENIKALRKDVLAKCYGGDISRKMKLLKKQAEGKKKMKMIGRIQVPKDTFIKVLKK